MARIKAKRQACAMEAIMVVRFHAHEALLKAQSA